MALVLANTGQTEVGAGTITGLSTATAQTIWPPPASITTASGAVIAPQTMWTCRERQGMYIEIYVVSDKAFKLDYQFTTDSGTTWYIGDQVSSATVTVDGGAAGYVNNASINIPVGYQFRCQVYQTSGGNAAFAYEYRYYSDAG